MDTLNQLRGWTPADWVAFGQTIGPLIVKAIIFALIAWILARIARASVERAAERARADASLRLLLGRAIYVSILLLGTFTVLDTLGMPLGAVLTVTGVLGIGISLALQDILKNFFAGTYLLFERPFRIGDVVQVKEQRGTVETIGVRTITLRTAENVQIMVPNAMVFTEIVLNRTHEQAKRAADDEPRGV